MPNQCLYDLHYLAWKLNAKSGGGCVPCSFAATLCNGGLLLQITSFTTTKRELQVLTVLVRKISTIRLTLLQIRRVACFKATNRSQFKTGRLMQEKPTNGLNASANRKSSKVRVEFFISFK